MSKKSYNDLTNPIGHMKFVALLLRGCYKIMDSFYFCLSFKSP